jgi:hypothetical protein
VRANIGVQKNLHLFAEGEDDLTAAFEALGYQRVE